MAPRVDATSTSTAVTRGGPDLELLASLQNLSPDAWEYAVTQSRSGGQVSEAQPEVFALYRKWLQQTKQKDAGPLRAAFLDLLVGRLAQKAEGAIAETGGKPTFLEAVALMKGWSAQDEAAFNKQAPNGQPALERRSDRFDVQRPRSQRDEPIRLSTIEESYDTVAKTPDEALTLRADKVARDDRLMQKLKVSVAKNGNPFTGVDGEVARRAYVDFLSRRGMNDGPESRQLFVDLLGARRTALANNGVKDLDVPGEKRFYAEQALQRLASRTQGSGPIELGPTDRWMISALADPSVKFSPEQQKILDRVQWHDFGLRTTLGEHAAKLKAASAQRPIPGAPFKTMLNARTVFDGDPQRNAFTLAARNAGYSQAEIDFAIQYVQGEKVGLYVDRDRQDEPLIMGREAASVKNIGGQDFAPYSMSSFGSLALRDARLALQHGYASVKEYRDDFNNTWSDKVGALGGALLAAEQAKDKALGLEQSSITGPLVRGKYDAMRELILVGSNAANLTQMVGSNTLQFVRTGDPFVSISDDAELTRYYDGAAYRVEQTFTQLGKSYTEREEGLVAEIARGTIAGVPKMAVNLIPGAAIYYNALKHANHDINEFAKETAIDLASIAGGFALSRVTSGASALAARFIDNQVAQTAVKQVVERGVSAVGGATMNVALDMGPTAVKELLRTDAERANMTDAEKNEVAEKLSLAAFKRNVWSGIVFGLVMPGKHEADDFVTLSKPGATLEGPLFRTLASDGSEHYYSAVKVKENGQQRIEFIEADPQSPKVKAALKEGRLKEGSQPDIDLALAESRWGRLDEKQQLKLAESANTYAAKKLLADADQGVQRAAQSPVDALQSLQKSQDSRKAMIDERKALTGQPLDELTRRELGKVSKESFHAAFGEGPYTMRLMDLFAQPGFGELVQKSPEAAKALYLANNHTDVVQRIATARNGLKATVAPAEVGPRALQQVLAELQVEGTTVSKQNGFFLVERQPGQQGIRPFEMVLDDVAFQQTRPELDANGKFTGNSAGSDQMVRMSLGLDQVLDANGKPIDTSRTALVATHGWTDGLTGMTPEAMNMLVDKIATRGDIDNVVLVACSQGDRRPTGATYGQKFWADLNAQVKAASGGKKTVEVYASKDPGLLSGNNDWSGWTTVTVNVPDNRPRQVAALPPTVKPARLVPVMLQGELFDVPPEWKAAYDAANQAPTKNGERPAFVYVIRVVDKKEDEQK